MSIMELLLYNTWYITEVTLTLSSNGPTNNTSYMNS